ncbi:MAG: hypothetical protein Q9228_003348 [Teloschistes exilis]
MKAEGSMARAQKRTINQSPSRRKTVRRPRQRAPTATPTRVEEMAGAQDRIHLNQLGLIILLKTLGKERQIPHQMKIPRLDLMNWIAVAMLKEYDSRGQRREAQEMASKEIQGSIFLMPKAVQNIELRATTAKSLVRSRRKTPVTPTRSACLRPSQPIVMLTISQPAASKSTSSPGSISDKQYGLSTTQTKHSTDIDNDPGKSKKGEGYAETAKAQGAVDPQRPMAENRPVLSIITKMAIMSDYLSSSLRSGPLNVQKCQKYVERTKDCKGEIPPDLSFERIISNKALPPCSLQDFIDYLAYVTNDAENLQFYLWLVDYHQRFRNAPSEETALSPKWNFDDLHSSPRNSGNSGYTNVPCSDKTLSVLGINDFDAIEEEDISNASLLEDRPSPYTAALGTLKFSELPLNEAKPLEGSSRRSASTQPFRVEINRIITHYIAPGSPRELNLSHKDRAAVLYALRRTTHPSAFLPIKKVLDMTLRNQSHPNFVRWSICNGNKPWTIFLRTFAVCNIAIGFAIAILLTLSHASRWYRMLAAFEWWFGITNLIAAYQGLCVLLLRRHTREIRPWEIDEQGRRYGSSDEEVGLRHSKILYEQTKSRWPVKMELFGPPNTWDHKNWMDRYGVKSIFKKTFEKEVPTQEHGLHFMQNKIVRQAEAWALIITIPLTIFFTALPKGNLY